MAQPPAIHRPFKVVAKERRTYNGVVYASLTEARRAQVLDGGSLCEILWWIGQPLFRLGCPENIYRADFLVVGLNGVWVEDVKCRETREFRRNVKLWRKYGPCELRVVKPHGRTGWKYESVSPERKD